MDKFEASFIETRQKRALVWFRYVEFIYFMWTHDEKEFNTFLKILNELDLCIKFTYESNTENLFLNIKVSLRNGKVFTDVYFSLLTVINVNIVYRLIHTTLKCQLSFAKICE